MAAPLENQFWKLRSKHGRNKLFGSAKLLWEAACEYFQWCDDNPWVKKQWVGKEGREVELPTQRPYTMSGLCLYLNTNPGYFSDFKASLEGKEDKKSKDFSDTIARIEEVIRTMKYEGAAVGAFNASLIGRDLGMVEKVEAKNTNTNFNHNSVELTPEEIRKYTKELEEEI